MLAALGDRGQDVTSQIAVAGERAAQSLDRAVAVLGDRGQDVSGQIAEAGDRAVQALDSQMAGLAALLTRRADDLIAAVNGAAADPIRALSALAGQVRAEVTNSSETSAERRRGDGAAVQ